VVDETGIAERYGLLTEMGVLDERGRRLWAAVEARSQGRGGIAAVVRATGVGESTVRRGLEELERRELLEPGRVRRAGAGQKPIRETNPAIEKDLGRLLEDGTRGDPESPLRWTSKSAAKLAVGLVEFGHHVSEITVARVLKSMGFSLQANRKTREGSDHLDRDAQFSYINETAKAALAAGEPVISVDTKKRELGVPRTQQGRSSRRSDRVDAVTALEMEGLARWGWWSSAVALQGEAANHRKALRSKAVVLSVAGKGAPSSASGMGQEGERKRSTDDVSKASR